LKDVAERHLRRPAMNNSQNRSRSGPGSSGVLLASCTRSNPLEIPTPIVSSYLVERKRRLIEDLAPVLAKIFIALFVIIAPGLIVAMAVQRTNIVQVREQR